LDQTLYIIEKSHLNSRSDKETIPIVDVIRLGNSQDIIYERIANLAGIRIVPERKHSMYDKEDGSVGEEGDNLRKRLECTLRWTDQLNAQRETTGLSREIEELIYRACKRED